MHLFTTEDAEDTEVNLVHAGAEMNESFLSTIKLKNIKTSATCNETRVIHQLIDSCNVADTCGRQVADKVSATRYIIKEKALIPLCKAMG